MPALRLSVEGPPPGGPRSVGRRALQKGNIPGLFRQSVLRAYCLLATALTYFWMIPSNEPLVKNTIS